MLVNCSAGNFLRRVAIAFVGLFAAATLHAASTDDQLPAYRPNAFMLPPVARYLAADGLVQVVGYNDMSDMLNALALIFTKAHPGVRFAWDLKGTRFAPAALASGASAFAPMGAEFTPGQRAEFRAATGVEPIAIRVAHASLDAKALSGPLAIFVHADNPLAALALGDVARVFTGEVLRWGELGLEGAWADHPIHLYGVDAERVLALYLREKALGGKALAKSMRGFPQSADVVRQVADDKWGIGFAAAIRSSAGVRALALAAHQGGKAVAPTPQAIMSGTYPLDRFLLIHLRRPIPPVAREFLRLVLSREGQAAIAAAPQGYLPLSAREAAIELAKLDERNE